MSKSPLQFGAALLLDEDRFGRRDAARAGQTVCQSDGGLLQLLLTPVRHLLAVRTI